MNQPLAVRMRPETLDELFGQGHLLTPGSPLKRLVEEDASTSVFLWGPPGVGKALANGTPVLTPDGWKKIEDLVVGDLVIGRNGRPVHITGVFPQGIRKIYRLIFSDGACVDADEDHIWALFRARSDKPSGVVSQINMTTKEILDQGIPSKYIFPIMEAAQHPEAQLPIDPYLLGSLIADGSFTQNSVTWSKQALREPDVVKYVHDLVVRMRLSINERITTNDHGWTSHEHRFVNTVGNKHNDLIESLRALGLWGKRSADKFIPEQYMIASIEQRTALLNGLFDGDGRVRSGRNFPASYEASSDALARDVLHLIWSLGLNASIQALRDGTSRVTIHTSGFNPFKKSKNRALLRPNTKWNKRRKIIDIKQINDQEATCISVDASDQLYVTKDYVVTHNTTIAHIIANSTSRNFIELSAAKANVRDLRNALREAAEIQDIDGTGTVLFIDEIHRFTKAQQDSLLHAVEDRAVTLVAATTENPSFSVINPLLSRSLLLTLEPLTKHDVAELIGKALTSPKGLDDKYQLTEEALEDLVQLSAGDARRSLTYLEEVAAAAQSQGVSLIDHEMIFNTVNRAVARYDRDGDQHYDIISAFIKALRGSDPSAALHWLARMIDAGEKPEYIARRLVVHASEDVGMADPTALLTAVAAAQAVQLIGMPEAGINLAHATIAVASAAKSNAVIAGYNRALADVKAGITGPVPMHLRDSHYASAAEYGHGLGYKYPHDYPGNVVEQDYLPLHAKHREDQPYYQPTQNGNEALVTAKLIRDRIQMINNETGVTNGRDS